MDKYGYELMLDCAKFWSNHLESGEDGKPNINDVVGPDEYKEQAHVGGIYKDYNQEQITKIQVSKQADVMVLFLLPEELFPHQVKLSS